MLLKALFSRLLEAQLQRPQITGQIQAPISLIQQGKHHQIDPSRDGCLMPHRLPSLLKAPICLTKPAPAIHNPFQGGSVTDSIIDASAADAAQKQPQASLASEPIDLTPPRFELHFTRVGRRGVWVCDDADQLALLEGFARRVAMAMAMPFDPSLRIPSFRWPFIEQGREDQSSAVAKQALVAQWQFLRTQGVSYVISFGPNAKDWLTRVEAKGYLTDQPLGSWIQQPGSKRALWLRLLDIQQREHQEL
jgi:hypothetical protein